MTGDKATNPLAVFAALGAMQSVFIPPPPYSRPRGKSGKNKRPADPRKKAKRKQAAKAKRRNR